MSGNKCLKSGNTVKRCRETIATCARCSNQGHNKDESTSTEVRCCHRKADLQAFSRICPIFKRETEIIQIQPNDIIPRLQAERKLHTLNQNRELVFSNAVKKTSNPTRTKSPTISEQESQSDSCEDTNVLKIFENFGNVEDNSPTVPTYGHGYYTKERVQKKRIPLSPPLDVGGVVMNSRGISNKTAEWDVRS